MSNINQELVDYVQSALMSLYDGLHAWTPNFSIIQTRASHGRISYEIAHMPDGHAVDNHDNFAVRFAILRDLRELGLLPKGQRPVFEAIPCSKHFKVSFLPYDTPRTFSTPEKQLLECLGFGMVNHDIELDLTYKGKIKLSIDDATPTKVNYAYVIESTTLSRLDGDTKETTLVDTNFGEVPDSDDDISFTSMGPVSKFLIESPFDAVFELIDRNLVESSDLVNQLTKQLISNALGVATPLPTDKFFYYVALTYLQDEKVSE